MRPIMAYKTPAAMMPPNATSIWGIKTFTRVGTGGNHNGYEREARTEVAGHTATYDDEKDECADTREKIAVFGLKPMMMGARTVAPNMASTCCKPRKMDCPQGSRSSGAMMPPVLGVQPVKYPCLSTVAIHSSLDNC